MTQKDFLEKLCEKNKHYRDGEFEIIGKYVDYNTPLIIKDSWGLLHSMRSCTLFKGSKPIFQTALNKIDYLERELKDLNDGFREGYLHISKNFKYEAQKVHVEDKYGVMLCNIHQLRRGKIPTIETAINKEDYFSEILKERNFKIWEKVKIIKYESFSKIYIDSVYGKIAVSSNAIFEWDSLSIKSAIDANDFWVKRAIDLRDGSNNIDYSNVEYVDNKKHVKLLCKIHNYLYTQRPSHHMANVQGCPHCATSTIKYSEENFEKHKEFFKDKRGILYVINLSNSEENFYKVGITGRDKKYRMTSISQSYNVKIEYTEEMDIEEAFKLEQFFLEDFKNYRYIPKTKFKGYTECLTTNPVAEYYHWYYNK